MEKLILVWNELKDLSSPFDISFTSSLGIHHGFLSFLTSVFASDLVSAAKQVVSIMAIKINQCVMRNFQALIINLPSCSFSSSPLALSMAATTEAGKRQIKSKIKRSLKILNFFKDDNTKRLPKLA
jgi:hypothetical protein